MLERLNEFITDYMALPDLSALVISSWVLGAWLSDVWDRFPHLCVTSPEKRCGKSTLLDLVYLVVPRPRYTTNISPAALYRVIQLEKPTLLMDESQSLSRRGSEQSEVMREILNAGIGRNAKVTRCGGERMDQIQEFSVYAPKLFAMIGEPDAVLADRCLPILIRRKTKNDSVKRFRSRTIEPVGSAIRAELETWADQNNEQITKVYDELEPFDIENDRMADLLLPLQAVLTVIGSRLDELAQYAHSLDERDRQQESQSPGVRLLVACREVFAGRDFMPTDALLCLLHARREEPWYRWSKGQPMTREAIANVLRPYNIRPQKQQKKIKGKLHSTRGYFKCDFEDAWERYTS